MTKNGKKRMSTQNRQKSNAKNKWKNLPWCAISNASGILKVNIFHCTQNMHPTNQIELNTIQWNKRLRWF